MINNNYKGFIAVLNSKGYKILYINDSYWIINEFIRSKDTGGPYQVVRGKEITQLLSDYPSLQPGGFDTAGLRNIELKLNQLPTQKVEFDSSYKAIVFIETKLNSEKPFGSY